MQSVVVTGASTGIGKDAARILIENGFCIFGDVRKQEDVNRLSGEFGRNFLPVIFAVTDEEARGRALRLRCAPLPCGYDVSTGPIPDGVN